MLKKNITESAANRAILLEMAMQDVKAFSASVSAVPDDQESKAMLAVSKDRVRELADKLNELLVMMDDLGMDTSDYQSLAISATGQITTDLFDFGVVVKLLKEWSQSLLEATLEGGPDLIFKLLLLNFLLARMFLSVLWID